MLCSSLSLHHCSARHPVCQHSDFLVVVRTHCVHHTGLQGNTQLTLATTTTNWNKPPLRLQRKIRLLYNSGTLSHCLRCPGHLVLGCLQGQNGINQCVSNWFTLTRALPFFLCTCAHATFVIGVGVFSYNALVILINRYGNVSLHMLVS